MKIIIFCRTEEREETMISIGKQTYSEGDLFEEMIVVINYEMNDSKEVCNTISHNTIDGKNIIDNKYKSPGMGIIPESLHYLYTTRNALKSKYKKYKKQLEHMEYDSKQYNEISAKVALDRTLKFLEKNLG